MRVTAVTLEINTKPLKQWSQGYIKLTSASMCRRLYILVGLFTGAEWLNGENSGPPNTRFDAFGRGRDFLPLWVKQWTKTSSQTLA